MKLMKQKKLKKIVLLCEYMGPTWFLYIYMLLSAVEHMTAEVHVEHRTSHCSASSAGVHSLRVLPHQAGVALALRASESWTGALWNPSAWKMGERCLRRRTRMCSD